MPRTDDLLPASVAYVDRTTDVGPGALLPPEHEAIAQAVASRQAEFTTVRHCARSALAEIGHAPVPILPGPRREPRWPAGVVGSLTHCPGYRAAAVAWAHTIATVGIDAEPNAPLPGDVTALVTVGGEVRHLRELTAADLDVAWDRLLFSAKESIYKAWFPLTGAWLDFTECELAIGRDGSFVGHLLVDGPTVAGRRLERLRGRWTLRGAHLVTACWEPAGPPLPLRSN